MCSQLPVWVGEDLNGKETRLPHAPQPEAIIQADGTTYFYPQINIPEDQYFGIPYESAAIGTLIMGNNSVLRLNNSFASIELSIPFAFIKGQARIISEGFSPDPSPVNSDDEWIKHGWWQADTGENGQKGVRGLDGKNGVNGTHITIKVIGINELIGGLFIESIGGSGGDASAGGKGQLGGNGNRSIPFRTAGNGGDGGDGGNGGNAGNGGNVVVNYYLHNSDVPVPGGIIPLSTTGKAVGKGGAGGEAPVSTIVESKRGVKGNSGRDGFPGIKGQTPVPNLISKP